MSSKNLKMFCITIHNDHYEKINNLGYSAVGLGDKINSDKFLRDNTDLNITSKNQFYGEYTFHYWLWKNKLRDLESNSWIGFCQYRKFWINNPETKSIDNFEKLNSLILKEVPKKALDFESIIGKPFYVNNFKFSKFLKKNFKTMIKKPSLFFNKDQRNLKFHFDMMHGHGNLEKAIGLLEKKDQDDFNKFVNTEVSFNPHNMFICKSKEILNNYYESVFPWLERCESIFGFDLKGYGLKRIYGFLAERYMSFWFKKYTKFTTLPIVFQDISDL